MRRDGFYGGKRRGNDGRFSRPRGRRSLGGCRLLGRARQSRRYSEACQYQCDYALSHYRRRHLNPPSGVLLPGYKLRFESDGASVENLGLMSVVRLLVGRSNDDEVTISGVNRGTRAVVHSTILNSASTSRCAALYQILRESFSMGEKGMHQTQLTRIQS